MLHYHVAFHLPKAPGGMVLAEALDFPGAVTQGFDLQDARLMICERSGRSRRDPARKGKASPDAVRGCEQPRS